MIDYNLINKAKQICYTESKTYLAEKLGIQLRTLNKRLDGKKEFKPSEVLMILKLSR